MFHYYFGAFCLQTDQLRLLKDGEEIHLKRKEFLVLQELVQDAPLPVDHDKFRGRVWKKVNVHLARSLAQAIYVLRKELGDKGPDYRFIKNRSGWSYEFVAPVQRRLPTDPRPDTSRSSPPESRQTKGDVEDGTGEPVERVRDGEVEKREAVSLEVQPQSRPQSAAPPDFVLRSRVGNPRMADFRDIKLPKPAWRLKCRMRTNARYFRFGFKFLTNSGRIFGDTTIESRDENLVVHIGRNNWNREGISPRDLFIAAYRDGARLDFDRRVLRVSRGTPVDICLSLNRDHALEMQLNGAVCFLHFIHPSIADRVLVMAWGDHDDCQVEVEQLLIRKSSGRK